MASSRPLTQREVALNEVQAEINHVQQCLDESRSAITEHERTLESLKRVYRKLEVALQRKSTTNGDVK